MKIDIYKDKDRYFFKINDFDSARHYFLCDDVKSSYKSLKDAYAAACNIKNNKAYHIYAFNRHAVEDMTKNIVVDISAEQMLLNHYYALLQLMGKRSQSHFKNEDEKQTVFDEISQAIKELNNIKEHIDNKKSIKILILKFQKLLSRYFHGMKAKEENKELQAYSTMMHKYADQTCDTIKDVHPDCFYIIRGDMIFICEPHNHRAKGLLRLCVNKNKKICGIYPEDDLRTIYPLHSVKFYQKYWKPIVEANGHFYINDKKTLIISGNNSLPDTPMSPSDIPVVGDKHNLCLSFRGKSLSWFFKEANADINPNHSKYTEQDFIQNAPRRVQCIDPILKSIYGKIGEVVQVIPMDNALELDIDFGRHIVRLDESQIILQP